MGQAKTAAAKLGNYQQVVESQESEDARRAALAAEKALDRGRAEFGRQGWCVVEGDCVAVMQAMDAESVDAVVCDPPYGLEFMGKDWDRLTPTGGARFTADGMGKGFRALPSFHGSPNPSCLNCGGTRRGRDRKGFTVCKCDDPQFPDTRGNQQRAMQAWHGEWAREALRVLKPGGHLVAFGGTRTYHRLACALEDAGFEVRDCLAWMYGTGFPKSLDVSKAIDKEAGAKRKVVGKRNGGKNCGMQRLGPVGFKSEFAETGDPVTAAAAAWQGWGTALKPAFEPIVLARKPISERTVAANVQRWGTGALNIDATRITATDKAARGERKTALGRMNDDAWQPKATQAADGLGRFPANVILDEVAGAMLDAQSGMSKSPDKPVKQGGVQGFKPGAESGAPREGAGVGYGDSGGASRFFYCAKASTAERNVGLEDMPKARKAQLAGALRDGPLDDVSARYLSEPMANSHPTVKPVALMRWLIRLLVPPGGIALDPFAGSGSTLVAAREEGIGVIGIEREAAYAAIARKRTTAAKVQA